MERFRRFITVDRLVPGLVGTLFGILLNVISSMITDHPTIILILVSAVAVGGIVMYFLTPVKRITTVLGSPVALRSSAEYPRYARKGLIAVIPRYIPPAAQKAVPEQERVDYRRAAADGKWELFEMEGSNFAPIIKSIAVHKSKLKHCWLISTGGRDGSTAYVEILVRYLRENKIVDEAVQFHYGTEFQILINKDDTEVVEKTHRMVDDIFGQAAKLGLTENDVITDITSGPRAIPLGMTLACLDDARDLEHMGTHYKEGLATGEPLPMIFHFAVKQNEVK